MKSNSLQYSFHTELNYFNRAEDGDYSVVHEIARVLENPYDEQSDEINNKWFQKTPQWATDMPGCTFMSCSS